MRVFLLALAVAGLLGAQERFAGTEAIDSVIEEAVLADQMPGAVVWIGQGGKVLHRKAYGSRLTRECEINRVNDTAQKRYAEFTAEIDTILSDAPQVPVTFPKTQALMTNVQNALNGGRWAPLAAVSDAENSLYALERRLKEIRDKLGESQTLDGLKKSVAAIQERQRRIAAEVKVMEAIWVDDFNRKEPKIGEAGAQSLTKGEAKKIQHAIQWRQYVGPKGKEDELQVKVTASDPSITVPPELTLNFERHEFRFEYEIKAGTKDGTFKITLTPAVGKPVEVQVIVK